MKCSYSLHCDYNIVDFNANYSHKLFDCTGNEHANLREVSIARLNTILSSIDLKSEYKFTLFNVYPHLLDYYYY
jgi:hypothetical protein